MDRRAALLLGAAGAAGAAAVACAACAKSGLRASPRDAGSPLAGGGPKVDEKPAAKSRPRKDLKSKPRRPLSPRTGRASAASSSLDLKSLPKEQRSGVLTAARAEKAAEELRERGRCVSCALVLSNCVCDGLSELRLELAAAGDVGVRFALWMHVSERVRASNTGKLMERVLPNCEVFLHGVPADAERFQARVANCNTYLLFPSDGAVPLSSILGDLKKPCAGAPKAGSTSAPLMVLVDGTWDQAKRMHKSLKHLPHVALDTGCVGSSAFSWRHQSEEGRVTTAEAAALVLEQLGSNDKAAVVAARCLRRAVGLLDRSLEIQTHYSKADPPQPPDGSTS